MSKTTQPVELSPMFSLATARESRLDRFRAQISSRDRHSNQAPVASQSMQVSSSLDRPQTSRPERRKAHATVPDSGGCAVTNRLRTAKTAPTKHQNVKHALIIDGVALYDTPMARRNDQFGPGGARRAIMAARHAMITRCQCSNHGYGDPQYGPNLRSKETRVCYVPGCGRRTTPSRYTCPMHMPTTSGLPESFPAVIEEFERNLKSGGFHDAAIYSVPDS